MDLKAVISHEGPIFRTTYANGLSFTFRLLTQKEYRRINALRSGFSEWELYETVFSICYYGDVDLLGGHHLAGYTISIGRLILWMSGDCDQDIEGFLSDIETLRTVEPSGRPVDYMAAVILKVCPGYTFADIDSWSRQELLQKYVRAENILELQAGLTITATKAQEGEIPTRTIFSRMDFRKAMQERDSTERPKLTSEQLRVLERRRGVPRRAKR